MNFLKTPATRRDLLSSSAVQTILLCLVIFAALIALIRMQDQQDSLREQLAAAKADLADTDSELEQAKVIVREVQSEVAAEAQQVVRRTQEVVRPVRTVTERVSEPVTRVVREVVAAAPTRRDIDVPSISLPSRPVRTPVQRPSRPSRPVIERPQRPERAPILPQVPERVPPAPAPPAVVPEPPPVVAPPIVTPAPPPAPGQQAARRSMPTEEPELPMTTYVPGPPGETPRDPYPNKAIAAAVTTLATVAVQWISSGELGLEQEGITAIGGAVATLAVWLVSNWRRKGA